MYIGVRKREREKLHDVKLVQVDVKISPCLEPITYNRSAIFLCQKPTTCNRLVMVKGGVS